MQLEGKSVLLTGGTDGIGKELALILREHGANVLIVGRNPERCAGMRSDGFETVEADLATETGIDTVVDFASGKAIDILINNAGMGENYRPDDPATIGQADKVLQLNLHAPIALITALLAQLRKRPEAMIVNVTSGLAIAPRGGGSVYCASKAGLRSYTQSLRRHLRDSDVHVLEALPPLVATKMTAGRGEKKMTPQQCAQQIVRAMEQSADEANIGMVRLLRAIYSVSPALARRIMLRV